VSTNKITTTNQEDLVRAANTLGLASDLQVFHFVNEPLVITEAKPPPAFQVQINEKGIQELNLTITPGGYSPIRFAMKKDIPAKIVFRQMGQVGCGNVLIFPIGPNNQTALTLKSLTDVQILEFTPRITGDFQFMCTNNHFRGIMTIQ
jgi:plastocyanin domain-containing protein